MLHYSSDFAIKVPIFPFHTWLPPVLTSDSNTYQRLSLPVVLLKMGTLYAPINFPIFPQETNYFHPALTVFRHDKYCIWLTMCNGSADFKKLIAYSSIAHMGYVIIRIGIASQRNRYINGAIFQMFNHGTITSMPLLDCSGYL